jgi:HK97 family phage portal protein
MMWPFNRRATPVAPESKSLAAPTSDLLELFGATPTAAGVSVTVDAALRVPAVSCAIRTIAEAAASLDIAVKRVEADGSEVDAPEHPVSRLLRGDVNEWTSGPELIAGLVADALISDAGGTAYVNRTGDGRIVEVIRYRRGSLSVDVDAATDEPTFRLGNRVLPARDVLHVRAPLGRAPLTLAREAIGVSVVLERHAANLFSRGARPSGALLFPKGMGEDAVRRARAAWRATHEVGDAGGRTAILFDGAEFKPFALSSVDAQFMELRRFQLEEIARAFNIPAPMIGDLTRATWANLESKHREFWSTTLEPWLLSLEAAMRRALFTADELESFVIRFDRDDFGRADLTARATAINGLIASRVLSPNEGRNWLGLAPREGGDEFANPNINPEPATPAAEDEES